MTGRESLPRGRMRLARWEVWVIYSRGDERVKESLLGRHIFRFMAKGHAENVNCSPGILAKTIESMQHGPAIFVDAEVRPR